MDMLAEDQALAVSAMRQFPHAQLTGRYLGLAGLWAVFTFETEDRDPDLPVVVVVSGNTFYINDPTSEWLRNLTEVPFHDPIAA